MNTDKAQKLRQQIFSLPSLRSFIVKVAAYVNESQASSWSHSPDTVPLTFVTASDTSHAKSLGNLLTSIHQFLPYARVVVFDLGMTENELVDLKNRYPFATIEAFPWQEFPAYFDIRIEAGQYAWKAQCVEKVASTSNGDLFWVDAGCVLIGNLKRIRRVLARRGVFANRAAGPSSRWTHPSTFVSLGAAGVDLKRDQLAATFVGFQLENPIATRLIASWAFQSRQEDVIAPAGSNRSNHRQDQSVFSILMYARLAESTPKNLLTFIGYWPKTILEYLTHQDVD